MATCWTIRRCRGVGLMNGIEYLKIDDTGISPRKQGTGRIQSSSVRPGTLALLFMMPRKRAACPAGWQQIRRQAAIYQAQAGCLSFDVVPIVVSYLIVPQAPRAENFGISRRQMSSMAFDRELGN